MQSYLCQKLTDKFCKFTYSQLSKYTTEISQLIWRFKILYCDLPMCVCLNSVYALQISFTVVLTSDLPFCFG